MLKNNVGIEHYDYTDHHGENGNFINMEYIPDKKNTNHGSHSKTAEALYNLIHDSLHLGKDFKAKEGLGDLTILDTFNLYGNDSNKLLILLEKITSKPITALKHSRIELSKSGLEYLSMIVNDAIDFYEKVLFRKIPKSFFTLWKGDANERKINFTDTTQLLKFLNTSPTSTTGGINRQIQCNLLKLSFSTARMYAEEGLETLIEDTDKILKKDILPQFLEGPKGVISKNVTEEENEGILTDYMMTNYSNISKSTDNISAENPIFTLFTRTKTWNSILLKLLSVPKYDTVDSIKDALGLTAEVKNKKDAILLLQFVYFAVFKGTAKMFTNIITNNIEIKDKGILDIETLDEIKNMLHPGFYEFMTTLVGKNEKKGRSNDDYEDLKIAGKINGIGVEFKIVLEGNSNEDGYSFHPITHCMKVIETMCRLQGYVTLAYINKVIANIANEHKEELRKRGIGKTGSLENTVDTIREYYLREATIIRLSIPDHHKPNLYTVPDIWNKFHGQQKGQTSFSKLYPSGAQVTRNGTTNWTTGKFKK